MCDRKDWAIDIYHEANEIIKKDYSDWLISRKLYNTMMWELILKREHMEDSDHRTFQKDIYKILSMKDICSKCLLPPSNDCDICNWTQINDIDVIFSQEYYWDNNNPLYQYYTNIMK